ncbi:MAG: type II toxin-antitoxin system RelE/ParE family toxin [Rickettsiales bacterium]|jgi:hypothetical protein|nr:type II toxin-antitoxin system RelE/ParE family toxin [Rickettsiales bacterium]
MNKYVVQTSEIFENRLDGIIKYIYLESPQIADKVFDALKDMVGKLSYIALACPVAYEAVYVPGVNLRQVFCKNFRIIFVVRDDNVFVAAIQACRQNLLSEDETKNLAL